MTPLKTPNPEPEDEHAEDDDQYEMKPLSNSSSVELVASPDNEELHEQQDSQTYTRERMESLELKPGVFSLNINMPTFEEAGVYCFAHVGPSVGRSVPWYLRRQTLSGQ